MRFRVMDQTSQRLLRTAAIVLITGFVAGCSSDVMRFTDGISTGSTSNQRSTIRRPAAQPYPQPVSSAPAVDGNYTGSINRGAVTPVTQSAGVQRSSLPPVSSAPLAAPSATAPRQAAPAAAAEPRVVRPVAAGEQVAAAPAPVRASTGDVIVQPGESLFGIANRLGVSPNALMQANGITDANNIKAGQRLKLPGGQGTTGRGVIAADGTRTSGQGTGAPEKVLGQIPQNPRVPAQRPANSDVAILPQTPAIKEKQPGAVASAATAPAATTPPSAGTYTVKSGDSLFSISQKTGASVEAIKKANGLANGAIRVGQALVIPGAGAGAPTAPTQVAAAPKVDQVKTGSTPPAAPAATQPASSNVKPYTPPQTSSKVIEDAETDVASAPSSTGISQMRWPVRGRVLSSFGQREGASVNDGIDIMVPEGTPVKAAENGVVIYAGDGLKEFGNTVLVRHDNGLVTVYGHNSQITVQRGQKVRRGQEIARSGMSGNAKSPKLHFEVRKNSSPVNPSKYLES